MVARLRLAPSPTGVGSALPAPSPIRVVLADDHALMRRALRMLLDGEEGVEVIAEAADLASVVRLVHSRQPDVLVLDLNMPDGSGIETLSQLREQVPETQIVVITMQDSPAFAQRAFAGGATGFVVKELADEELPQAVRAAAQGEEYVSSRVMARLNAAQNLKVPQDRQPGRGGVPAGRP